MMSSETPTVRWGIVATGMISEWFVTDLLKPSWPGKSANHIIAAIGSSSLQKCKDFTAKHVAPSKPAVEPKLYGSYKEVYSDANVDCVYIGTPHSFHRQNCLDAINAGKHVLCEKPFAMNAEQASEVFQAAKEKNVFIMEAMWTRFYPLVKKLQDVLFVEKKLGSIYRTFCDFGLDIDIVSLPETSRYKDPALGAGSLLDIGIYSLTWGIITLANGQVGGKAEEPDVQSQQTIEHSVDVATIATLLYPSTGRQAICSSTTNFPGLFEFARIEGSRGHIIVRGSAPSAPESFTFHPKGTSSESDNEHYEFDKPGIGLFWEADAVAHDIAAGRIQNETMPWAETLRVMAIMDGIRQRGGAKFPVDKW